LQDFPGTPHAVTGADYQGKWVAGHGCPAFPPAWFEGLITGLQALCQQQTRAHYDNLPQCIKALPMRIALYQPEIAGNVGAILRLAACFSVPVDIIMPTGFAFSDARLKRAAMDYGEAADVTRHANFAAFDDERRARGRRLLLMSAHASQRLPDVRFQRDDVLLMGSESAGVPPEVRDLADIRVRIPMAAGFRSLNVAVSTGIAIAEALRQTESFPS
jgi:tRNA (cytidine/uridine-2'-O-)-methyltransferase